MLFKELSTIQCFSYIEEIMIYNWQIGDYEKSDENVNIISTIKKIWRLSNTLYRALY